jgi:hypothetical protein
MNEWVGEKTVLLLDDAVERITVAGTLLLLLPATLMIAVIPSFQYFL